MSSKISFPNQESGDNQGTSQLNVLYNPGDPFIPENSSSFFNTSEEQAILANYAKRLCTGKESEMIVLSSNRHYFYDSEEMKNVKVVTSLKELNKIADLKNYLQSLYNCLQPKTFFLGHFKYDDFSRYLHAAENPQQIMAKNNEEIENGIRSRFIIMNRIYNLLDAKAFNPLSSKTVELHLRSSGFRVIDMTFINLTTCFCAQRMSSVEK